MNIVKSEVVDKDQTEITTDGGIEVFQNEKYYDLKINVKIKSTNFDLEADNVKVFYENDFYDLVKIIATGEALLNTPEGAIIEGAKVIYELKNKKFYIYGNGKFVNNELVVIASEIIGSFKKMNNETHVNDVKASDSKEVYIENKDMKSYSKSAIYRKKTEILELFDDVKIIKNREVSTGDYANINMLTNNYFIQTNNNPIIINGYQIKSNDNKVKLLISTEKEPESENTMEESATEEDEKL